MPDRIRRSLPLALLVVVAVVASTVTPMSANAVARGETTSFAEQVSVNSDEMRANGQAAFASVSASLFGGDGTDIAHGGPDVGEFGIDYCEDFEVVHGCEE